MDSLARSLGVGSESRRRPHRAWLESSGTSRPGETFSRRSGTAHFTSFGEDERPDFDPQLGQQWEDNAPRFGSVRSSLVQSSEPWSRFTDFSPRCSSFTDSPVSRSAPTVTCEKLPRLLGPVFSPSFLPHICERRLLLPLARWASHPLAEGPPPPPESRRKEAKCRWNSTPIDEGCGNVDFDVDEVGPGLCGLAGGGRRRDFPRCGL